VDVVALQQVSLPVLLFSSVSTIPPTLHAHLHLHVGRTSTNGRSLGTFQRQFFWKWGASDRKVLTVFCLVFEGVIYPKVYTDGCPFSYAAGFPVCPPNIRLEPGSCKRTS